MPDYASFYITIYVLHNANSIFILLGLAADEGESNHKVGEQRGIIGNGACDFAHADIFVGGMRA